MFESPVTFILYTFARNVSLVPYVKLSARGFWETDVVSNSCGSPLSRPVGRRSIGRCEKGKIIILWHVKLCPDSGKHEKEVTIGFEGFY